MTDQESSTPSLVVSTVVTPDDHGAQVVVVCILCLIATVLSLVTRLSIRWPWPTRFGIDDMVCVAATAMDLSQTAMVLGGVGNGFGQRSRLLRADQVARIEKIIYASNLMFVVSLFLGKLAVTTLFCRLAVVQGPKLLMAVLFAYGVSGVCVIALGRPLHEPWKVRHSSVSSTLARWAAVEAIGTSIDLLLIAYPFFLIRKLKLPKSTKVAIILGFALRFPVIIVSALRLVSLAMMDYGDFTYSYVEPEILAQVEMHYNTIAATIPCLRVFLKDWQTGFLGTTLEHIDPEEYTRHSLVAQSPRTLHSSSSKSQRLFWVRKQRDMSEIFDGESVGPTTRVSSQQEHQSASRGSKGSITVEHTIKIESA